MSESVICLPPRVSLCTYGRRWEERASKRRLGKACPGWWGPSLPPNPHPHLNLFLPVFTAAFGLFTAQRCVLKTVYLTKNMKARARIGEVRQIVGVPPLDASPYPGRDLPEQVYSSSPGKGAMVLQGLRAKGSRHVGWRRAYMYSARMFPGWGQKGSVSMKILSTMGGGGTKSSSLR